MRPRHSPAPLLAAVVLCAAAVSARPLAAQESVVVSLTVGGKHYSASGRGQCRHAAMASIYDVRAAMWSVEFDGGGKGAVRSLGLTVWHPLAGGADQMSFAAQVGSDSRRIDTVKRPGGPSVGAGTAVVTPRGEGVRFDVDGRDAGGTPIKASVSCPHLAAAEAVAG